MSSHTIYLYIYGSTVLVELGRFISFLIYTQSVGFLGRGIRPSQGRHLHTNIHASCGIRTTISTFERAKTVHALDREATAIGITYDQLC
jgi:hypothetical protein